MMFDKFLSGFRNPIEPVVVKDGPCKEEIYKQDDVDLEKFPTPVRHEKDADLDNWNDIWWRIYSRSKPHRDVWITPPRQHGGHQPLVKQGFTSRIAIDATSKFKGIEFPEVNSVSREISQKVLSRWAELGPE